MFLVRDICYRSISSSNCSGFKSKIIPEAAGFLSFWDIRFFFKVIFLASNLGPSQTIAEDLTAPDSSVVSATDIEPRRQYGPGRSFSSWFWLDRYYRTGNSGSLGSDLEGLENFPYDQNRLDIGFQSPLWMLPNQIRDTLLTPHRRDRSMCSNVCTTNKPSKRNFSKRNKDYQMRTMPMLSSRFGR